MKFIEIDVFNYYDVLLLGVFGGLISETLDWSYLKIDSVDIEFRIIFEKLCHVWNIPIGDQFEEVFLQFLQLWNHHGEFLKYW